MAELTKKQFDLIADMMRSREPARTAAYMVLVQGRTNQQAIAKTELSPASVSNTLGRYRQAHKNICEVYEKDA